MASQVQIKKTAKNKLINEENKPTNQPTTKNPHKTKPHNKFQPKTKGYPAKSIRSNNKSHFKYMKNRKPEYLLKSRGDKSYTGAHTDGKAIAKKPYEFTNIHHEGT